MKTIYFYPIVILILLSSCKTLIADNNIQKEYLNHLNIIKDFAYNKNKEDDLTIIFKSVKYLEEKTNIKSDVFQSYDPFPYPTKKNYKQWKNWYLKNKDKFKP